MSWYCSVMDALYVLKTFAVSPSIKLCKYLLRLLVCETTKAEKGG